MPYNVTFALGEKDQRSIS